MSHVIQKGNVYGVYTVLDDTPIIGLAKQPYYKVHCACGNDVLRTKPYLLYGRTHRCMCYPDYKFKKGAVYGIYTVVDDNIINVPTKRGRNRFVLCRCICGTVKKVHYYVLSRNPVNCTCYYVNKPMDDSKRDIYRVWAGMVNYCKRNPHITIDESIRTFDGFVKLLGPTYIDKAYLKRIDKSKGYSADNCIWFTYDRDNIYVEDPRKGDTVLLSELSRRYNIRYLTLWHRYKAGERGSTLCRPARTYTPNLELVVAKAVKKLAERLSE